MTTVPLWEHAIVVLTLLGSNATLFFITKRKIETLQMALVAKRVLMRSDERRPIGNGRYDLLAGEQLKLAITQQVGAQTFSTDVHIDMLTAGSMMVTY